MQSRTTARAGTRDIAWVARPYLPDGTVTLFFSDIEGSTQLLHQLGHRYADLLAAYRHLVRSVVQMHDGHEVDTQGDSFFVAFTDARAALLAAAAIQQHIAAHPWPDALVPRTRIALHTGRPQRTSDGYVGLDLHRGARLCASGHGGQLLLSESTRALVAADLPSPLGLRALGQHRLKDLTQPEHVFQVVMPDVAADFPPLRTLNLHPHNLPVQPTPLIGRDKEVRELVADLRRSSRRLVTLTGPGGTGKTRLALQVAAEVVEDFPDGAWFVDLAPLTEPALVVSTIARVLNVRETGEQSLLDALSEHLRGQRLLLVLDNFEQVTAAAPVVGDLLRAAQGLKVVVTSREVLRLQGEQEYLVPPLEVPGLEGRFALEEVEQCAAVQLFVQRAQAVRRDFQLMAANAAVVAEICVRLDGLPLAIELAAARVKVLPPEALLQRLGSRLKLLTGGARDLPARQQTLRNTIEWSYSLLPPEEQTLFARLAVFVGGRTLEAIEAVCDATGDLGVDVLDGVQSLIDKSLLRQEEGPGGEPRFVMLETIHEYAREHLEATNEAEEIRRRHVEYFVTFAEAIESDVRGPRHFDCLKRLEAEIDNFRAALRYVTEAGSKNSELELALRLCGALSVLPESLWIVRGYWSEGLTWVELALETGAARPSRARAAALFGRANLTLRQGNLEHAAAFAQDALGAAQTVGYSAIISDAHLVLGTIGQMHGNTVAARTHLNASLALAREQGDPYRTVGALAGLAALADVVGDADAARMLGEETLSMARAAGASVAKYTALMNLGIRDFEEGNYAAARARYTESLILAREFESQAYTGVTLCFLGELTRAEENYDEARAFLTESLELLNEVGDKIRVVECLEVLASIEGLQARPVRAAKLFGTARVQRSRLGYVMKEADQQRHEHYMELTRAQLPPDQWEGAWAEGRAMTREEAITFALEIGNSR